MHEGDLQNREPSLAAFLRLELIAEGLGKAGIPEKEVKIEVQKLA